MVMKYSDNDLIPTANVGERAAQTTGMCSSDSEPYLPKIWQDQNTTAQRTLTTCNTMRSSAMKTKLATKSSERPHQPCACAMMHYACKHGNNCSMNTVRRVGLWLGLMSVHNETVVNNEKLPYAHNKYQLRNFAS